MIISSKFMNAMEAAVSSRRTGEGEQPSTPNHDESRFHTLMYKTAVYAIVNGGVIHIKNSKYQKKVILSLLSCTLTLKQCHAA